MRRLGRAGALVCVIQIGLIWNPVEALALGVQFASEASATRSFACLIDVDYLPDKMNYRRSPPMSDGRGPVTIVGALLSLRPEKVLVPSWHFAFGVARPCGSRRECDSPKVIMGFDACMEEGPGVLFVDYFDPDMATHDSARRLAYIGKMEDDANRTVVQKASAYGFPQHDFGAVRGHKLVSGERELFTRLPQGMSCMSRDCLIPLRHVTAQSPIVEKARTPGSMRATG